MTSWHYNRGLFEVESIDAAKTIILTTEKQRTTEERWASETGWTAAKIVELCGVSSGDTLLDYGCGVGRIAKEILRIVDVDIIGVDISSAMLKNASRYVDDDRFCAMHRDVFVRLARNRSIAVDHAYAVYVLQHVEKPAQDIQAIGNTTQRSVFVVNNTNRVVPIQNAQDRSAPWIDDGFDVAAALTKCFPRRTEFELDYRFMTPMPVGLFSAVFSKEASGK